MAYCYNCGHILPEFAKFCPDCGANVEQYNQRAVQRREFMASIEGINKSAEAARPKITVDPKVKEVRGAYSRAALGVISIEIAMTILATVVAFPSVIVTLFNNANLTDWFTNIFTALLSGVGVGVGVILMKVIRGNKRILTPIEKKKLSFPQFLMFLAMTMGLWGIGVLVGNFPELLGFGFQTVDPNSYNYSMILLELYTIIGAPILEELAMRKILIDGLNGYGETAAVFTSALTFGILHGNSGQFFLAFFVGIVFATIYQKTGKVIYTIILHFIVNLTASIPEIIMIFTNNPTLSLYNLIEKIELIVVGAFIVIGAIVIVTCRKSEILRLQRPAMENMNSHVFKNVGMRILIIGGMVLIAITDCTKILTHLSNYAYGMRLTLMDLLSGLIQIIPTGIAVATIIICTKTMCKHSAPVVEGPGEEGLAEDGQIDNAAIDEIVDKNNTNDDNNDNL